MRIAVYTSGGEALPLFKFLKTACHEYVLYVDWNAWPVDDKGADFRQERLDQFFADIKEKHIDAVVLPPLVEVAVMNGSYDPPLYVLPLFTTYLENFALKHSLVGKLGVLTEAIDERECQALLEVIATKSDHISEKGRSRRVKKTPLWKYYLTHLGAKEPMIRKTIRHDLSYFKDAAVDTLIPTSWGHFAYQPMIKHMVSRKRMRFHGLDSLATAFEDAVTHSGKKESSTYSLEVMTNGNASMLLEQKRWKLVLNLD